jgi:hypothetical protein
VTRESPPLQAAISFKQSGGFWQLFLSFWQSEYAIVETTNSQMELS